MDNSSDDGVADFIDEGIKQQEQFKLLIQKEAIRVHKVFAQTTDGRELLEHWIEQLVMIPTVHPAATQFEAGINEGIKQFVRNIITQCKKLEIDLNNGENK